MVECDYKYQVWKCSNQALDNSPICLLHTEPRAGEPDRTLALTEHLAREDRRHRGRSIHGMHIVDATPLALAATKQDLQGHGAVFHGALQLKGVKSGQTFSLEACEFHRTVSIEQSEFGEHFQLSIGTFHDTFQVRDVVVNGMVAIGRSKWLSDETGIHIEGLRCESFMADNMSVRARLYVKGLECAGLTYANHTTVKGSSSFRECKFGTKSSFLHCDFLGGFSLHQVSFRKTVMFHHARFAGYSRLAHVELLDAKVEFDQARFEGPALLQEWHLDGTTRINFERCHFLDEAAFDSWMFDAPRDEPRQQVILSNLPIGETTRLAIRGRPGKDMTRREFPMQHMSLLYTDAARIRFTSVDWSMLPAWQGFSKTRIRRVMEEDFMPEVPNELKRWKNGTGFVADPIAVADLYRGLRVSYENHGGYAEAGAFHIQEMATRRLAMNFQADVPWPRRKLDGAVSQAYNVLSRYGESWKRPFVWLLATIALAWLVEARLGSALDKASQWIPAYPSLVAAIDAVIPLPVNRLSMGLLGVFGAINLTLLVLALRRQFMRH